jgi:tRNA1(Val) A37 N6-methylase TrmN6
MGVGIGGDKWPAADQFCSLITDYRWAAFFEDLFSNKKVIELGSGTGQVGMLVDMLYNPVEVLITDLASHIPLIVHNMSLNPTVKRCKAAEFDWFRPPKDIGSFDVILIFEW